MNKNLFKTLENLRQIQPDQGYSRRSRHLLLSSKAGRKRFTIADFLSGIQFNRTGLAIAGAIGMFILIILGAVYYFGQPNQSGLIAQANEINATIQIKLDEIKYHLDNPSQLDFQIIAELQSLLEKTAKELEDARILSSEPKKMEEVLSKIQNAQEDLVLMESMMK